MNNVSILKNTERNFENYRACVGIFLVNKEYKVFIAQRIDFPSSAWQMPQGGIDEGETPHQAALREMLEEIGTNNAEIVAELEPWFYYDFPENLGKKLWQGRFRGQRQKWLGLRFLGEDKEINIHTSHPEFQAWRWANVEEITALAVPFKQELYKNVIQQLYPKILAAISSR